MYGEQIKLYKREPSGRLLNGAEYTRVVNGQLTVIVKLQDGAEEPLSALAVTSIIDRRKEERHPGLIKKKESQQPLTPTRDSLHQEAFRLQADLFRQQSVIDAQQAMLVRLQADLGSKAKDIEHLKECIQRLEETLRDQTKELVCLYMVIEGFRPR
jgi:hypothetical protein